MSFNPENSSNGWPSFGEHFKPLIPLFMASLFDLGLRTLFTEFIQYLSLLAADLGDAINSDDGSGLERLCRISRN